jgi:hypothetical protein
VTRVVAQEGHTPTAVGSGQAIAMPTR